ncbi:MAG: IS1380 family transposase [Deltaproteobacteria bacterium]|nr:IS1380 family transposase [Deltaproteobacteria bacterium]
MSVARLLLPFKVVLVDEAERITAHAALPLIIETLRAILPNATWRQLRKALGYSDWKAVRRHVESIVALVVSGGEHLSDLDVLRGDAGLRAMLDFDLSSPTQAKDFLYRFHQSESGSSLTPDEDAVLSVKGTATIRPEGPGLSGLDCLVLKTLEAMQAMQPRSTATLDVDATIIEAHKALALRAYEGTVGYQPQMALWAEQGVWVCDEFRDGNVPAAFRVKDFIIRAFGNLPETVTRRRLRGDSALYDEEALSWMADHGKVDFVVTADMSASLEAVVKAIPDGVWRPYRSLDPHSKDTEEREWAEVINFVPAWKRNNRPGATPFRYIAVRVRTRQRDLFEEDDNQWRHFAVVTNMDWAGDRLLRWHREKQGTVEFRHGVVKNDLGGGVLPCGRFGANAAWWRLNVLAHNVLELLKSQALPEGLANARPKTLRFQLFNLPGRVVRHARTWVLKLYRGFPLAEAFVEARRRIAEMAALLARPPKAAAA